MTAAYTAADGNGGVASGVITFLVEPVNDLPIGQLDVATLDTYLPFVLDVLRNDRDVEGDILRVEQRARSHRRRGWHEPGRDHHLPAGSRVRRAPTRSNTS